MVFVEFTDDLDGFKTSPRLPAKYALLEQQQPPAIFHGHGKKIGSRTDSNPGTPADLPPECDLDTSEIFAPAPTSSYTFEEAGEVRRTGPLAWGWLPSHFVEERVDNQEFLDRLEDLRQIGSGRPIVLGTGDAVKINSLVERVRQPAKIVEQPRL